MNQIFDDLRAEYAALDALVGGLTPAQWALPTPAPGWTIAHQVAHLAWTDRQALLSATDPDGFRASLREATPDLLEQGANPSPYLPGTPLEAWREARQAALAALREVPPGERVPWFGPPMAAPSMATARLMETWAHGLDIADALGVTVTPTHRLRHVAHIAVRARDYAFSVNGQPAPAEPFYVVLTGPSGEQWTWGPSTAAQRVTGSALDFCLLAVRRRHRDDLAVHASGPDASRWLDVVQAYAGPPGPGRAPVGATAESSTH
ncbi:TIGR03084 family metal-binding protein [Actinocorallia sp. A-T 12471]|uniref:TIGR03084 family metal-binding protein n=1 Tax=Actinocorallia sp. A-T 12471 TaxID=3089813 RepID=UPI0029CE08E0|nr:TIGR03084 family metal-binding protein [Actinocorallia sp. A-T 12471]MDX6739242.1 TIGR03084 family metal-binding protein [Actinocorallia sp. A-T 12471]